MVCKVYSRGEHGISRSSIDSDALKIMGRLHHNGYKGYLVGGGVRDLLLGKDPKDFDIATDATPRRVKSLFPYSRIIGRRFKLVHAYFFDQKIIEISTFRDSTDPPEAEEEVELLKDDNKFGTEETDALRRDITINGLFYDAATSSIIDYVDGMEDMRRRVIRVIGDPEIRFREDPVRLLRVVRHAVKSTFQIESECLESLQRNANLITKSSGVRVYEELKKDFCSGYSLPILQALNETGILPHILPDLSPSMLHKDSPFALSLGRLDEMFQNKETCSSSQILVLIALFGAIETSKNSLSENPLDDPHLLWNTEEELEQFAQDAFPTFSVPRKERERIMGILTLWFRLMQDASSRKAHVSGYLLDYLNEVQNLMRILPMTAHDKSVIRSIDRLKKEMENEDGDSFHPRRRRRRKTARHQHPQKNSNEPSVSEE